MRERTISLLVVLLAAAGAGPGPAAAQEAESELGVVEFPTSCSADVQPLLERGLLLLHHMMYGQAAGTFEDAIAREEECAMAHWGLAMSRFQPLWGEADVEAGRGPAERAVELGAPTEREQLYAQAGLAFFEEPDAAYNERLRSWEQAMEELHRAAPDDQEAASLYALAHLAVDPADRQRQERARSILEPIHEAEPEHPGAVHYSIHVHDVDRLADEGVHFAGVYDEIAPSIPHALHMPSHIYVRTGAWEDVIEWNRRSADAALDFPEGDFVSMHHIHALDYLMYGYLQRGQDAEAESVLEEMRSRGPYQPAFGSAYALAAIPARWLVERRDWSGAAELEARAPESFPWDRFPGAEAITYFARGLGAARTGDTEAARSAVERLEELEEEARAADDAYWARQTDIQRRSVSAWTRLVDGDVDRAIEEMRSAVELANEMEKHPVTPGDLQPTQELLGDLLLEADRPEEALAAYEESLETWPRRYHSLLGAARAADAAGHEDAAVRYYEELIELAGDGDSNREGLEEARRRVAGG